jgi:hypothetical protein
LFVQQPLLGEQRLQGINVVGQWMRRVWHTTQYTGVLPFEPYKTLRYCKRSCGRRRITS